MSDMWIPAHTTMPPGALGAQRGGHELADRGEDDRRVERLGARHGAASPAHSAPSDSASSWAAVSSARVKANTRRPSCTATWQTMWAAAPKP